MNSDDTDNDQTSSHELDELEDQGDVLDDGPGDDEPNGTEDEYQPREEEEEDDDDEEDADKEPRSEQEDEDEDNDDRVDDHENEDEEDNMVVSTARTTNKLRRAYTHAGSINVEAFEAREEGLERQQDCAREGQLEGGCECKQWNRG